MAIKEHNSDDFCFLNPPEFIGLEKLRIETGAHPNGDLFRIAGFRWNSREYWFMPHVVSSEKLDCGLVYLYLKGGSRLYTTQLVVRPSQNLFQIDPPEFRKKPKGRMLIIKNFSNNHIVDMAFLKAEDKRLWARKYTWSKADLTKIARPPRGLVV